MVGDINLFLTDFDETEDIDYEGEVDDSEADLFLSGQGSMDVDVSSSARPAVNGEDVVGEIELMIASPHHRRQGLGRAASLSFLDYIFANLDVLLRQYSSSGEEVRLKYLRVKIGNENAGSIGLFESIGFVKARAEPNYFGEVELRLAVDGQGRQRLRACKGWEEVRVERYEE